MRILRRKALAVFMAVLLGMASFAVLAEEPLESENAEIVKTAESVSNGDSVIYDKTFEKTDDIENEDREDRDEELEDLAEVVKTEAVVSDDDAVMDMATPEEMDAAELLAGDQGIVYAADDIASGVDGDITWVIDVNGKLTVNGTGDFSGNHFNYGDDYGINEDFAWSRYRDQITSAELNVSGMTDASYLFYGCSNIVSVDLSNFDTSIVTDMSYMFTGCSSLPSLDVRGFDTRNVKYMIYMFGECISLSNLDVSGFDTHNVTYMPGMFWECSSLSSLDVSGFDTRNVTELAGMFNDCSSLSSLDVSGFDTSNVTNMAWMFDNCRNLSSLDVSGFDTRNVTDMQLMFNGCSSLVSVDVSGFDTSSVTSMGYMFCNCSGLKSLDLSGFDTSNVTDMRLMFSWCRGLESLDVSGFNTRNVTKMDQMFCGCSGLESLDLSCFDICNVKDMDDIAYSYYMLSDCANLITINSPYNVNDSVSLPYVPGTTWHLPDGTEVTELPQGLNYSVTLTRSGEPTTPKIITTTDDLNMADVIRVKYVPYSYTVATDNTDAENTVAFSITEGSLPKGLQISPTTSEIYGVPLEAGEFKITVMATYSKSEYPPSYAELSLIILDNMDNNVGGATDPGYEITQPVADFNLDAVSEDGTQTLVSQGEYAEFQHLIYIDGQLLEEGEGKDYTSEAGSTRITILNRTLADSGVGTHTLSIEFRTEDGTLKRAAQNYTVSNKSAGDDEGEDKKPENGDDKDTGNQGGNENASGNQGTENKPSVENPPSNSGNNSNTGNTSNSGNSSDIGNANNSGNSSNTSNTSSTSNSNKGDTTSIEPTKHTVATENVTAVAYTIVSGDTLWKIADRFYGNGSLWTKIFADNADTIKDANKIYVGQVILLYVAEQPGISEVLTTTSAPLGDTGQLPTTAVNGDIYVVQTGDSLWKIAAKFYGNGRQWRKIYEANQEVLRAPGKIYAGQQLIIPEK